MQSFISDFKASLRSLGKPRTLVYGAMLIALNIVLTRFLAIQTQFLRISFSFLPIAIFAMLAGPVPGAIAAAIADILGALLFPSGPFFFGFTLSALIYGLIYGISFYKKEMSLKRITIAVLIVSLLVDAYINTHWLAILWETQFELIFITRLVKALIMAPVQILTIALFCKFLGKKLMLD